MQVKIATQNDVPKIMPLLIEMHKTAGLDFPPIDPDKVVDAMFGVVSEGLLLLAVDKADNIVGVMALMQQEFWFSRGKFVADLVFYVSQKHRKSTAAAKLMKTAQNVAKKINCPLMLSVLNGIDVDRKETFYTRMGLKKVGGTFGGGL